MTSMILYWFPTIWLACELTDYSLLIHQTLMIANVYFLHPFWYPINTPNIHRFFITTMLRNIRAITSAELFMVIAWLLDTSVLIRIIFPFAWGPNLICTCKHPDASLAWTKWSNRSPYYRRLRSSFLRYMCFSEDMNVFGNAIQFICYWVNLLLVHILLPYFSDTKRTTFFLHYFFFDSAWLESNNMRTHEK